MNKKIGKGLLMLGLLPLLASLLPSCAATYQLDVENDMGDQVISCPKSRRYAARKKLEIVLSQVTDIGWCIYLNQENIFSDGSDKDKVYYSFAMPAQDSSLVMSYDAFLYRKEFPFSSIANLPPEEKVASMSIFTYRHRSEGWEKLISKATSESQEDISAYCAYREKTATYEKDAHPKGDRVEVVLRGKEGNWSVTIRSVGEYLYQQPFTGPTEYFHVPGYHPEILHPVEEDSSSVL